MTGERKNCKSANNEHKNAKSKFQRGGQRINQSRDCEKRLIMPKVNIIYRHVEIVKQYIYRLGLHKDVHLEVTEQGLTFCSVAPLCPTLCDPMNRSTPGLPVYHQLPESIQTHVH